MDLGVVVFRQDYPRIVGHGFLRSAGFLDYLHESL